MRFAILCPGKSLRDTWKGGEYRHIIGVTAAIFAEPRCDIWCCAENPAHKHQPRYQVFSKRLFEFMPTIWTVKNVIGRWHKHWEIPKDHPIIGKNITEMMAAVGWPRHESWHDHVRPGSSFFHAVFGALEAGATEIHIYGHDMDGACNYHPVTGEGMENKKPEAIWNQRWQMEKNLWLEVKQSIQERGITLMETGDVSSPLSEVASESQSSPSPSGTSSPEDPPANESKPEISYPVLPSQSIELFESEIERLFKSGPVGTTPPDSSTSDASPTSTLPSSFGSDPSDSKSPT
jgi:hypothetical protein